MNREKIKELLLREIAGKRPDAIVAHLVGMGIVSHRFCEQQAIRLEVDRLVRKGLGRCEAMERAGELFSCSYAKVRQAIYYKPKN